MPNSEVKRSCADDSVGSPHAKVGHYQIPIADMAQLVERTLGKGERRFKSAYQHHPPVPYHILTA